MKHINATAFKAKCLAIMDEVSRTGEAVIILKRGRPVAQLGAVRTLESKPPQVSLRGTGVAQDDLLEPAVPLEAWEAHRSKDRR
jgi:antitoxin (DNA-binding transcriptional repressor) of toxin-antitoxin stability system